MDGTKDQGGLEENYCLLKYKINYNSFFNRKILKYICSGEQL